MSRDYEDLNGLDPWRVLGVARGADETQIKRAHRRRTSEQHPDAGGDGGAQTRLNLARDVLLSPSRRQDYLDRLRRQAAASASPSQPRPTAPKAPRKESHEEEFEWVAGAGPTETPTRPPQQRQRQHFQPEPLHVADPPPPTRAEPVYQPWTQQPWAQESHQAVANPYYWNPPPYQYPRARLWSGLAITAFIVSLCCSPVGAVLAICALVDIKRTGNRGAGLAWSAIVISVVVMVAYLVLVAASTAGSKSVGV